MQKQQLSNGYVNLLGNFNKLETEFVNFEQDMVSNEFGKIQTKNYV